MLAMTLVVMLGQVPSDAPLLAQAEAPPVAEAPTPSAPPAPPAPAPATFIDPERARLEYELSQLKRDRPHFALPVTLMAGGTTLLGVGLLLGLGLGTTFTLVVAIAGAALATVGLVTFIIGINRVGAIDKQIAEKQEQLRVLLARPPTVVPPAPM
ncbi:MAG: hypothetical protein JNM17_39855 [Archangium sp.]|nr:hypothetical protein [Archangium sp.]